MHGALRFLATALLGVAITRAAVAAQPPVITRDLAPAYRARAGEPFSLAFQVAGDAPLQYAWYRNGIPIRNPVPAAPPGELRWLRFTVDETGWYSAVVRNPFGAVTSAVARVTTTVDPSNPTFAGRRWVPAAMQSAPTAPFGYAFRWSALLSDRGLRWHDDSLLWAMVGPGNPLPGTGSSLFRINGDQFHAVLVPGADLPNDVGPSQSFEVLPSSGVTDPIGLYVTGTPDLAKVGIYRLTGLSLQPWVDLSMPAPPGPNGAAQGWWTFHGAAQAGDRVVFVATTSAGEYGLYLAGDGPIRRVLDLGAEFGSDAGFVGVTMPPRFDGEFTLLSIFAVRTSGPGGRSPTQWVRIGLDGSVNHMVTLDSTRVPETNQVITGILDAWLRSGRAYAWVATAQGNHVVSWSDGSLRREFGPGTALPDGRTLQTVDVPVPESGGSRILFRSANVLDPEGATAVYRFGPGGIEKIIDTQLLDGRPCDHISPLAFSGDRIYLRIEFGGWDWRYGIYFLRDRPADPAPRLEATRLVPDTLHFAPVPGAMLEWSASATGPWEILLTGDSDWDVGTGESQGYFRLRRP